MSAQDLLQGFVETHAHAAPSAIGREFDGWELAGEGAEHGFRAIVLKEHFQPTCGTALTINQNYPKPCPLFVGSVVLNNAIGGLNAKAAEAALDLGAGVIWLPTVSARNHIKTHSQAGFPKLLRRPLIPEKPIDLLDERGRLVPELEEVLDLLTARPEVVLATGHASAPEVEAVIKRARQLGLTRFVATHPLFMVGAGMEDMKRWAGLGAYLEFTAINSCPDSKLYTLPPARIAEAIRAIGAERAILSSDAGLKGNGRIFENMTTFLELLRAEGLAEEELRMTVVDNPARLLGLDIR